MTTAQLQRLVRQAATGQDAFTVRCGPSDTLTEHDGAEVETDHGTYRLAATGPKSAIAELLEQDPSSDLPLSE